MGNSQSRRWQEQNLPPHLVNNPEVIAFLAITLRDDGSSANSAEPVPVCGIPFKELSSSWLEAASQIQKTFLRDAPPIYVLYQNKRITPHHWTVKKLKMAGNVAFAYFDERTPYQSLDTRVLVNAAFEVNVTIISSPFPGVTFPPLQLQILPASTLEALRALLGRWIELEVKEALQKDLRLNEQTLALHMVQKRPTHLPMGRKRAESSPARGMRVEGVTYEMLAQSSMAQNGMGRVSIDARRARAEPVMLPETGKVGEWTGWSLCVCVFEIGVNWIEDGI
ncbi:hypothetical protein P167DRAFT_566402 [Morchella conica CCBAS932]|uniref:Uncharacterized protein n=1 Tax=Morchella conica CCBAS932 TaxID=1392247 RepID=A0A3N4KML8_9PEZI|nr:hypothetical protein P167DRAFT_566402 [Morchella conica CCBAS932]